MNMKTQRTFAMIKPDAHRKNCVYKILEFITQYDLKIVKLVYKTLTTDEITQLYDEHKHKSFFGEICEFMSSHPVLILVLEHPNAVLHLREIMGATNSANAKPNTIRGLYGDKTSVMHNVIHGSDSASSAEREMKIFGLYDSACLQPEDFYEKTITRSCHTECC